MSAERINMGDGSTHTEGAPHEIGWKPKPGRRRRIEAREMGQGMAEALKDAGIFPVFSLIMFPTVSILFLFYNKPNDY